jgi:hypothetical protein
VEHAGRAVRNHSQKRVAVDVAIDHKVVPRGSLQKIQRNLVFFRRHTFGIRHLSAGSQKGGFTSQGAIEETALRNMMDNDHVPDVTKICTYRS